MHSGLDTVETSELFREGSHPRCEMCRKQFPVEHLTRTGMWEFYTMDFNPDTLLCTDCYEAE